MTKKHHVRIERKKPDGLALAVYERLHVGQPNIRTLGLWAIGERYYLVCPDIDENTKSAGGQPLLQWLLEDAGWPLPPIKLVNQVPSGGREVRRRKASDAIRLSGINRIPRDIFADLSIALGPDFPRFALVSNFAPGLEIHVCRQPPETAGI